MVEAAVGIGKSVKVRIELFFRELVSWGNKRKAGMKRFPSSWGWQVPEISSTWCVDVDKDIS